MGHIFISYSHKDSEYVEKLEKKLLEEGFRVWIDHKIDYGSEWTDAIEKAIDTCDAYIIVMSDDSKKSPWVQREFLHAEKRKKPFFPLLLEGEAWFSLGNIQHVDVTDKSLPPDKYYKHLATATPRKKLTPSSQKEKDDKEDSPKAPPVKPSPGSKKSVLSNRLFFGILGGLALSLALIFGIPIVFPPATDTPTPRVTTPPPAEEDPPVTTAPEIETPTDTPKPEPPPDTDTPELPAPTITDTPTKEVPTPTKRSADGMTMIYIPAGEFEMGSEDYFTEEPIHTVYLDAFWADQTEVTNTMFKKFVDQTGYETDVEKYGVSYTYNGSSWAETKNADWSRPEGPGSDLNGKANHPVIHITWNDARAYCQWAGVRLLTEAEWEKAARGTDGRKYPWGNGSPTSERLNFDLNVKDTVRVGNYASGRSPYGLYDMAGNVWEWVADWYSPDYYQSSPSKNPTGPGFGDERVFRGGSWDDNAENVTAATRAGFEPDSTSSSIGFRCGATP